MLIFTLTAASVKVAVTRVTVFCEGGFWLGKGQSFGVVEEDTELRGWIVDIVAFGLGKGWG